MITIMLSGTIAKQPESRTTKTGSPFTVASVRIPSDNGDLFASITAFSDLAPILVGMAKGDPITIVGQGKVSSYTAKDGEHRAGLSIVASRIIAVTDHQAPPKIKPKDQQRYRQTEEFTSAGPREFAPDEFADRPPLL